MAAQSDDDMPGPHPTPEVGSGEGASESPSAPDRDAGRFERDLAALAAALEDHDEDDNDDEDNFVDLEASTMDDEAAARRRPARTGDDQQTPADEGIRLQRVLAAAGIGSRRSCEELIEEGRVSVDGETVRHQGMRVDPNSVVIRVDGERIATKAGAAYVIVNKERGVVSTMSDDRGRPCVGDYVESMRARLFHVGRLDADSEGLLLLTNDGELANRLIHPSYGVAKTYLATVPGPVARDVGRRLRSGVELEDGMASVDSFRMVDAANGQALVEVILHEGRNHIVRRLLAEVGHPVSRLVRTQMGPLQLGALKAGRTRHLTRHEVGALYGSVDL